MIIVVAFLGLSFGSFVNALVWRLHEQSKPAKKRAASLKELSISKGRSMCPNCKHTLSAFDLVPLFSWLALRGKCRYCHHSIGWQYPLVELLTALLFGLSYTVWTQPLNTGNVFQLVCWLIGLVMLVALAVYDIRWMLLPNKIVFPFIALGIVKVAAVALFFDGGWSYALKALISVAIAGGIFYVLYQASGGKWIGGGDVKLGYGLGLFLVRPEFAFIMLFLASVIGLLVAVPGLVTKRLAMTSHMPFGPSLIAATIIVVLFGQGMVDSYNHLMSLMLY